MTKKAKKAAKIVKAGGEATDRETVFMSGEDFDAALSKLGFSQNGFGRAINVGGRTVRGWIGGEYAVPKVVAVLVRVMLKTKTTAEDL